MDSIIFVSIDSIVCQTNMHLIMRIENAFKFCGKQIHFYNERISFLFYCEDGKREAVSWHFIVNPITMDSIIFVSIDFRKLKKMASCGYSISWFVEFYQIINRSLENWYLSKLNETTVNKSHDDILINWVSTTCHFFQFTKIDTHKNNWIHSNRIYYNKWCVITYSVCVYQMFPKETIELSEEQPKPADIK
jgi:hypothetical protein